MKQMPTINTGESDFKLLRKGGYYYVDKTLFAEEAITSGHKVLLLPRPRRFGKTLNMSMLYHFFDVLHAEENRSLFDGLAITETESWKHFGKYPTVFITLKELRMPDMKETLVDIGDTMGDVYDQHRYLLDSNQLSMANKDEFKKGIARQWTYSSLGKSLRSLSEYLYMHHGEHCILLIDEYDSPIIHARQKGFGEEMIDFMKNFLSAAFKDNSFLKHGVITGILRVAKENIFSGLNNLRVKSIFSHDFADKFGFTQEEVDHSLELAGLSEHKEDVRRWYNGYTFGLRNDIYNPWSVLSYISEASEGFKPHWVNTSANTLVREMLQTADATVKDAVAQLLQGNSVRAKVAEHTIFQDLEDGEVETVLGLLVFNGYLKASKEDRKTNTYQLDIPNAEVATIFQEFTKRWLHEIPDMPASRLLKSFLDQDTRRFQARLRKFLLASASYYDFSAKQPEKVYHTFMLGLMSNLMDTHIVRSNREAGDGRADMWIVPKDTANPKGWIMEFKISMEDEGDVIEEVAQEALQQIKDRKYIAELHDQGKTQILLMGVAFDGKAVEIRSESIKVEA